MALELTERLIMYEDGELSEEATIELFQDLLDCGLCWQLQGSYGRMAKSLLNAGLITAKKSNKEEHHGRI